MNKRKRSIEREDSLPTISSFYGITIFMWFRDHAPAHFHVEYSGHKASVDIKSLEILEGFLPRRALNLVLDWAEIHQGELVHNWEACRKQIQPAKIRPLE